MFSHHETGSDPPIGSNRESGCDTYTHSCTHFIYSFTYLFQILIDVLVSYTNSCTHFIYLYVLLVLYQTVLSPVGVQN